MLDEMVMNGCIVDTNEQNIMAPITESRTQGTSMLMDKYTAKGK